MIFARIVIVYGSAGILLAEALRTGSLLALMGAALLVLLSWKWHLG